MISKKEFDIILSDKKISELTQEITLQNEREGKKIDIFELVNSNIDVINEYFEKHINCEDGHLSECRQNTPGYEIDIIFSNGKFYLGLKHCAHWKQENKNYEFKKKFLEIDYDFDSFSKIPSEFNKILDRENFFSESEKEERREFLQVAGNEIKKNSGKGIYLFGNPGIGKTTIMKTLANYVVVKQNKTVAFMTVSNLINTIKESFNDEVLAKNSKIISNFKYADVVFLDDIGGESVSNWSRDDLLFTILNYRMENNKTTFFTSNFSIEELIKNYNIKKNVSQIEKIKLKRFIERIKSLTLKPIKFEGESHR